MVAVRGYCWLDLFITQPCGWWDGEGGSVEPCLVMVHLDDGSVNLADEANQVGTTWIRAGSETESGNISDRNVRGRGDGVEKSHWLPRTGKA